MIRLAHIFLLSVALSCVACDRPFLHALSRISLANDQAFSNMTLAPSQARAGSTLAIAFDVIGRLDSTPTVTVAGLPATLAFQTLSHFVFTYGVTGKEAQGVSPVVLGALVNGSPLNGQSAVVFDFTPPVLGMSRAIPSFGTFLNGAFTVSVPASDVGGVKCEVCATAQCADSDWQPMQFDVGQCSLALECLDAAPVPVTVRALDAAGNPTMTPTQIFTCDTVPPQGQTVRTDTGTLFVAGTYRASANFFDAGSGVASCDVCTSQACATWAPAVLQAGTCAATATCLDTADVDVALRATDYVGHVGTAQAAHRVCDAAPPTITAFVATRPTRYGVTLSWNATDATSGLDVSPYTLTSGTTPDVAAAVTGDLAGTGASYSNVRGCYRYFIALNANDAVGNVSLAQSTSLTVGCGGDGTFAQSSHVGSQDGTALVLTDLNHDGILDVAFNQPSLGRVGARLGVGVGGQGSGAFAATVTGAWLIGGAPAALAAGDLNGDSLTDLVTAAADTGVVSVLLGGGINGVGDGTFLLQNPNYPMGTQPRAVVLADFNDDHILDVASVSAVDQILSVRRGRGRQGHGLGTFAAAKQTVVHAGCSLVTADFNADGYADLAGDDGNHSAWIMLNQGDGNFATPLFYPASTVTWSNPNHLAAADVNGDHIMDLVVAHRGIAQISVLLGTGSDGRGNGQFAPPTGFNVGPQPVFVLPADVNADGLVDLLVSHPAAPALGVLLGDGLGGFAAEVSYDTGGGGSTLAAADINADALLDVLVGSIDVVDFTVMLGQGGGARPNGTFLPARSLPVPAGPGFLLAADWNADHVVDLWTPVSNGNVALLLGDGALGQGFGAFTGQPLFASLPALGACVADLNQDGIPDAAYATDANVVSVQLGGGSGGKGHAALLPHADFAATASGGVTWWVAAADFNGDHVADLAVTDAAHGDVDILLGATSNGQGGTITFGAPLALHVGSSLIDVVVGDFNQDGIADLATTSLSAPPNIGVQLGQGVNGRGDGTFAAPTLYGTANQAVALVSADYNSDGIADLAVTHRDGTLSILLGQGGSGSGDGTFAMPVNYAVGAAPGLILSADVNRDAIADLVVAGDAGVSVLIGAGAQGRGDGTFLPVVVYPTPSVPRGLVLTDVDADGIADIIATDGVNNALAVLYGWGTYP